MQIMRFAQEVLAIQAETEAQQSFFKQVVQVVSDEEAAHNPPLPLEPPLEPPVPPIEPPVPPLVPPVPPEELQLELQ